MEAARNAIILSPVDRPEEVEPLADAGAGELYGGVIPDGWVSRDVAVNRRSFPEAQFPGEESFASAAKKASALGVKLHLTLNAPFYHPTLVPDILDLARRAFDWGVAGFIVSDPVMLTRLRRECPGATVTLSTMAGAMNSRALSFYENIGIDRAVLPRHLRLDEMESMVGKAPSIRFEAFVLVGKCPNEEAYCTFQHISPSKRWPCEIRYRLYVGESLEAAGEEREPARRRMLWMEADRRMGCSLCAVGRLMSMGVGVLKLVGRGGPTAGKVANVRLVRKYAEFAATSLDAREDFAARFGRPCSAEMCYFPEVWRSLNSKVTEKGA